MAQVNSARTSAAIAYPPRIAVRFGAASSRRRPNPTSKSRAMAKPVNTPPKADACRITNTNWNAV